MHHTPLAMAVAVALTLLAAPTAVSAQSAAPAEVAPRALHASFSDLPFAVSRLEISGSSVYPPAQVQATPPITILQALPANVQPPTSVTPPCQVAQTGHQGPATGPTSGPADSRSRDTGATTGQRTTASSIPAGRAWIVAGTGRQPAHALPTRTEAGEAPAPVHCVASGFGLRRELLPDGSWQVTGLHPTLRTTDSIVRNIPANHHRDAGCLIEIRRRWPQS